MMAAWVALLVCCVPCLGLVIADVGRSHCLADVERDPGARPKQHPSGRRKKNSIVKKSTNVRSITFPPSCISIQPNLLPRSLPSDPDSQLSLPDFPHD